MPRAAMIDKLAKLQAQEQKDKDAKAALEERREALRLETAEHARKAHQARLVTLGQLVEDVFGTMSMVEIAEILAELQGAPVGIPTGGESSLAPSRKTETRSDFEKGE